jgi:hypothetical protein
MSNLTTIKVPDIGDFQDVEIIEVLVHPGDTLALEDPMITLESEKASIDIPLAARRRHPSPGPSPATPTCAVRCWCWAPARAATPPPSAPLTLAWT